MLEQDRKIIQNKYVWTTYVLSFLMICFLFYFQWIMAFIFITLLGVSLFYEIKEEKRIRKKQISYISKLAYQVENAGKKVFLDIPLGIIIYDENFQIKWVNPYVFELNNRESLLEKSLDILSDELISQIKSEKD